MPRHQNHHHHDDRPRESGELVRLSISLEKSLNRSLDELIRSSRYENRSEFIRDLIRKEIVERQWDDSDAEVLGTVTLIYDHHAYQLSKKLTDLQHDHHKTVLVTTHVHLDHALCAEVVMLRGRPQLLREMFDRMRQQRGVLHGALSLASTGGALR